VTTLGASAAHARAVGPEDDPEFRRAFYSGPTAITVLRGKLAFPWRRLSRRPFVCI